MEKKIFLDKVQLYVIVDKALCYPRNIEKITSQAIEGGAQMIQFRDKESSDRDFLTVAERIKRITDKNRIPFIINDRLDIASYLNCDGVHLGQEDLPFYVAKKIFKKGKIIGVSAKTLKEAKEAEKMGADYIGLGPVFYTTSKEIEKTIGVEVIRKAVKEIKVPVFPIGGINQNNVSKLVKVGCRRAAVISAVICTEDVKKAAKELLERLKKND